MVGCIAIKVGLKERHCCSGQSLPLGSPNEEQDSNVLAQPTHVSQLIIMSGLLGETEILNDLIAKLTCLLKYNMCTVSQLAIPPMLK